MLAQSTPISHNTGANGCIIYAIGVQLANLSLVNRLVVPPFVFAFKNCDFKTMQNNEIG